MQSVTLLLAHVLSVLCHTHLLQPHCHHTVYSARALPLNTVPTTVDTATVHITTQHPTSQDTTTQHTTTQHTTTQHTTTQHTPLAVPMQLSSSPNKQQGRGTWSSERWCHVTLIITILKDQVHGQCPVYSCASVVWRQGECRPTVTPPLRLPS